MKIQNKDFIIMKTDFDFLSKSLNLSLEYIKSDLNKLGIKHNKFFYETKIINDNLVQKTIKILQDDNYSQMIFYNPKGEENKNWKKIKRLIFKSIRIWR